MEHTELVELIRGGVAGAGGVWADMGAGTGNFTWALRELLGGQGAIYAIDRDGKAIGRQRELQAHAGPGVAITPIQADITQRLALPPLDGVLMANVLHFIRDRPAALALVASYLKASGRVLVVEYDVAEPLRYVPFPLPFARFAALAAGAGLAEVRRVGYRVSPSSGVAMYAAAALVLGG